MAYYILRRIFLFFFVVFSITVFAFSLSYLFPGEPLSNLSGYQTIEYADIEFLEQKYNINDSVITQYFTYLGHVLNGDLGLSFSSQTPVFDEILRFLPATFELSFYALLVSMFVGVPIGIIAASKHNKFPDYLIKYSTLIGYSMPIFWWALLLIMLFCLHLGWLPMSGRISLLYEIPAKTGFMIPDILLADVGYRHEALLDALKHLLLPTVILATFPTTVLIRFTRDSMLEVLETQYIKTARAKGLSRMQVLFRHGLRNALLPVIRQIGLQFSTLITLAMLTEVIFSWPGIGRWLVDSIYQRDFPAIQGGLLAVSSFVIIASILADSVHSILNPLTRKRNHG